MEPEIDTPDPPVDDDNDGDDDDDFAYVYCCVCGIEFGMPAHLNEFRRHDGREFFCPNGHGQQYKDSAVAVAQREALQAKSRSEQLEAKIEVLEKKASFWPFK